MTNDNSLMIGTYLKNILSQDEGFTSVLSADKIYPIIVTDANINYPYVTYTRDNIFPQYTKAAPYGGWSNNVSITYRVYSGKNHDLGEEIANKLRQALEWTEYEDDNIKINPILLASSVEFFNEDGFCQQLTFSTQVE